MREDLLGYLLGALDEEESARVQAALESDPALAAECAHLEQVIAPLSEDEAWIEPPGRLADRTLAFVEASAEEPDPERIAFERQMALDALVVDEPVALSPVSRSEVVGRRRWTIADALVGIGICIAAVMLFVPAIAHSQRQAAIHQCQNKLKQIGEALVSYSYKHGGQFPLVPTSGNLGVAGVYAPILKESGQIQDDSVFVCPSSPLAEEVNDFVVPSTEDLRQQSGKTLTASQRKMGGSFGYAFGYEDEGEPYQANINRSRPRFAIVADSPSLHLKDRQSANHGGRGQNVFFEDGHVQYLNRSVTEEAADNVFLSDRGYVEAGRHWNDAVIGNSWARPVINRGN